MRQLIMLDKASNKLEDKLKELVSKVDSELTLLAKLESKIDVLHYNMFYQAKIEYPTNYNWDEARNQW